MAMFAIPEKHRTKAKFLIVSAEIVLTFLVCTLLLFIYHKYSAPDSDVEKNEKLSNESLKKAIGSNGTYVIRTNVDVDPEGAQKSNVFFHDHILGEFLIVCLGIFLIGLLVLGAVVDFRKPIANLEEVTTTNYSEMITRF